jgi:hypothetical protein
MVPDKKLKVNDKWYIWWTGKHCRFLHICIYMTNCVCTALLRIYWINAKRTNTEIYRVSHLKWTPPQKHATTTKAASKLPGNELVRTQPSHASSWIPMKWESVQTVKNIVTKDGENNITKLFMYNLNLKHCFHVNSNLISPCQSSSSGNQIYIKPDGVTTQNNTTKTSTTVRTSNLM